MEMKCVTPTLEDLPTIERLYHEMYAELREPPPPENWTQNVFQQALAGQRSLWMAYSGGELIGFADFKVMPYYPESLGRFARIYDLFIRPAFQRRGLGSLLARRMIETAKEQGADSVELNVLPVNAKALAFWKSVGFDIHLLSLRRELEDSAQN